MKLAQDVYSEQEIKKSRFLTYLHPCRSEQEAREFFKQIRKLHPQAAHVCTAIKIKDIVRSSDDGEPSGTAGRPMLDALMAHPGDEMAAAVVRYFGGTLLGKGGLVRAYSSSVADALQKARFLNSRQMNLYQLEFGYEWVGKVDGWLRKEGIDPIEKHYANQVVYCFLYEGDCVEDFLQLSSGALVPSLIKTVEVTS